RAEQVKRRLDDQRNRSIELVWTAKRDRSAVAKVDGVPVDEELRAGRTRLIGSDLLHGHACGEVVRDVPGRAPDVQQYYRAASVGNAARPVGRVRPVLTRAAGPSRGPRCMM